MNRMDDIEYIFEQNRKHTELFRNGLPMIASENLISPLAQTMLVSDFHNRYAEGNPGARYYQGNEFVDNVERKAIEKFHKKRLSIQYPPISQKGQNSDTQKSSSSLPRKRR